MSEKVTQLKPEVRTWYAFEGRLGEIIHNKRFFFAWKEGCLMGTYNSLEEATESLASGRTPGKSKTRSSTNGKG